MIRFSALVGQSHQFIHTFCDPEAFSGHFSGDLGAWTPCFIDVGLLGVGHLFACVCYTLWLHYISSSKPDKYRLTGGWPRALHYSCLVAAAAAAGIPLLQLNARLAEQALPLSQGAIAPHEWLGLLAAAASFLLLCAVLLAELQSSFVLSRRWLLRLPLLLVASSELVKLRFVVQQELAGAGPWGYFFWLYCAYAAVQVYLAAVLLLSHRDSKEPGLLLVQEGRAQYAPLPRSSGAAALLHDGGPVCPECTAGLWSRLTFGWLSPLIKRGYKTPLTEADLWSLPPADRVEVLEQRFHTAWQQQLAAHGPQKASLFAACRVSVGHLFLVALPFKLINDAAQFVGPLILSRLLSMVATQAAAASSGGSGSSSSGWWGALVDWLAALGLGDPLNNGYMLSLLMFVGTLLGVLADNQHFQRVMRAGFRLKAILTAEVYHKVLLLSPAERSRVTAGKLFNLVSSDTNTVGDFCTMAYGFLSAPLRIGLTMVLLYRQLGLSAVVAIVCIGAAVPVNSRIVRAAAGRLQQALRHTDTRAKLETELVAGIEVVKASTWEGPFYSRITAARALELSVLYSVTLLQSLMGVLVNAIPTIIPVMTFLAYLLIRREPLSAAQAFTALSLFNVLRFPLFQLPQIVTQATQAHVALGRLKDILAAAEVAPVNAQQQQQQQQQPTTAGTSSDTADAATHEDGLKPAPGDTTDDGNKQQQQQQPAICIHGDFSWDPDKPPALTDLSLSIPQGTFVAVVGPTGSGKTSLIAAMLGLLMGVSEDDDTQQQQQQVQVYGSTAYVPQAPFILGGTVRENILFGRPWDAARYAAAVAGAQLEQDFTQLPGGDETELGDRGVNVSGGQKQRIAIARALYADADVVLMDDPLSALDARVGRAVAQGAIKRGLAGKTVVLATNQLQFVSLSDLVVVMRGGCTVEVGSYSQLLAAGGAFAALMKEAQAEDGEGLDSSSDTLSEPEQTEPTAPAQAAAAAAGATTGAQPPTAAAAAAAGGKLTQDESSATGRVSAAVVWAYLNALGGIPAVLVLLGGFVGTELLRVGATVWLSVWTGQDPDAPQAHGSLFYMGVYAAISGAQLLVLQANYLCVAGYGIKAGRIMHEQLLHSLLGAPMSFFHTTPTGRIINRLTKDTADIDRNLASNLAFALRAMLQLASTVTLIAVGAPFSLPALLVMLGLFWGLYRYFIASMRQAKRLEAVSRSPVLSNVNEAIHGAATIRAFGITQWLIGRNMALVNRNAATSLLNQSLNRWLSVRLEGMGALCTLLAALVTVEQQSGRAATMGLLLTYALQITAATSMTLRVGSMAEQTFNAVERVQEYCQLPQELSKTDGSSNATAQRTATRTSSSSGADRGSGSGGGGGGSGSAASTGTGRKGLWGSGSKRAASSGLQEPLLPVASAGSAAGGAATLEFSASEGRIEFSDVNLRYRPGLPLVLHGLSFKVEPGWKVGVVGRTGAGKSSLIGALFRLTEIESGLITIDGVNTKALALRQLRCSMALIPQVPVLFTGSIRENLTPFGGHCDAALWSALRRAHLAPVVEQWEREGLGGLDYSLGEGGSPLSAGQKQLLALARALLNPAKILVLDEATANVDVETDALIQETLRQEFSDRTLLAVAHRLHTIIEADRVLVMQQGRAVEYGAPAALLKAEAGHFTSMVRETGEATEKFLRSMAAGDEEAHRELHDAAAAALVSLSVPCSSAEPACLAGLAANLAQGAAHLSQTVNGLLQLLQQQAQEPSGLAAIMASSSMQEAAGGGLGSRSSASTQPGLLPAALSGTAQAAGAGSAAATLQQLKAALAATAQLQQQALVAQQLLGSAEGVSAGDAARVQLGAGAAADGAAAVDGGMRRSSQAEDFQESFTGSKSPFAELLQQQLTGTLSGSSDAAAVAAAAAAASAAAAGGAGSVSAAAGSVRLSAAAQDASLSGHGAADALRVLAPSSSARAQSATRHAAAAAAGGSLFLRRLSLEVNPVGSHRRAAAAGLPGRASVDLAAGSTPANVAALQATPAAPSSSGGAAAAAKPAAGAADC